jgi:intracellular sulfur oxidation DsrE/DsrF family protein
MKDLNMKSRENLLNALADNELDAGEKEEMLAILDEDEALRAELCDIRRVKDLLGYAYPLDEAPSQSDAGNRYTWLSRAAGFLILLLSGFVSGWVLSPDGGNRHDSFRLADVQPDAAKVLLYLGDSDPAKFKETLKTAESLLRKYEQNGTEVYVVTSAGGVDLLRTATTSVAADISALKDRYASLHFVACNNTLFNLKKKGKPVKLVKEAEVAPSAVSFVVSHLKKGWTYMAI